MCVDVSETLSSNCLHLMSEADSSVSGHAVKVRKPYIITKQRERWTEEEHNKFLEALKQYGRAWRRIEEHIGSKTTVQIRSHAQKFFSKVVRETSNNRAGTLKPIEIPPPRPKRKPSHPYPRKLGHLSCNKASFGDEQLWSFIAKQSGSEQESKSPTSVLTPFGSDTTERTSFDMLKPCTSPVSSAGMTLNEQGSGSKFSSTSPGYKDKQSADPSTVLSMQDTSAMELDLDINEAPVETQQITTLKLFGRTVIVSGLQPHKNELELEESHSDCTKIDLETRKLQEQDKSDAALGEGRGESNPFYGGALHNNLMSHAEPNMISLPSWWALYEGMPCGFSKPPSPRLGLSQLHCDPALKESCQTESSTSSCNNFSNSDKSSWKGTVVQIEESLPQSSVLKPSNNSVSSSTRPSCANSNRGFMPYRR